MSKTGMAKKKEKNASDKKLSSSRQRLLQIAMLTAACLLLNMAATLALSTTLAEWSVCFNFSLQRLCIF
jgi:hypothetical protein